jgi:MOSC domain-containing protein YiiM
MYNRTNSAIKELMRMAEILAVCISEKKGEQKHPVEVAELRVDWGIVGDAHAGNWHRQVSLLGQESVDKLQEKISLTLKPGDFAENILVKGLCLYTLPVGTRLKIGPEAVGEVTQIGKTCHFDCAIRKAAGDCVMPREGIFVRIIVPGQVRPGDTLEVMEEEQA